MLASVAVNIGDQNVQQRRPANQCVRALRLHRQGLKEQAWISAHSQKKRAVVHFLRAEAENNINIGHDPDRLLQLYGNIPQKSQDKLGGCYQCSNPPSSVQPL